MPRSVFFEMTFIEFLEYQRELKTMVISDGRRKFLIHLLVHARIVNPWVFRIKTI